MLLKAERCEYVMQGIAPNLLERTSFNLAWREQAEVHNNQAHNHSQPMYHQVDALFFEPGMATCAITRQSQHKIMHLI
jgi:hypothetical protein